MGSSRFALLAEAATAVTTRRQIMGVLSALGLGAFLSRIDEAGAKKHRRKKRRCRKLAQPCNPKSRRKCCGDRVCNRREVANTTSCCKKLGATCVVGECCNFETGSGCIGGVCILI